MNIDVIWLVDVCGFGFVIAIFLTLVAIFIHCEIVERRAQRLRDAQ